MNTATVTGKSGPFPKGPGGGISLSDRIFRLTAIAAAALAVLLTAAFFFQLTWYSFPAFREFGLRFFWSTEWDTAEMKFGAACAIYGTLITTVIALLISVPTAFLTALFLVEIAPPAISHIIAAHKRIIFNGNGYTDEWKEEAARRGLPNAATTMEALRCLTKEENIAMFEKYHVYNRRELESRYEVFLEDYHRKIRIEGETALEIAGCMVQPAVAKEFAMITEALANAKTAGVAAGSAGLQKSAEELGTALDELTVKCDALKTALNGCHEEIIAAMNDLRKVVDKLERIVPDANWPLPKYREMLFIY